MRFLPLALTDRSNAMNSDESFSWTQLERHLGIEHEEDVSSRSAPPAPVPEQVVPIQSPSPELVKEDELRRGLSRLEPATMQKRRLENTLKGFRLNDASDALLRAIREEISAIIREKHNPYRSERYTKMFSNEQNIRKRAIKALQDLIENWKE
jgi:hypothetical protein